MSTLKVNSIANNGSAVDLPNGAFNIGGNSILQGYTSSATEPASPSTGDFWWDSTNELLYQYLNSEFKAIGIVVPPILDVSAFTYDNVSFSVSSQDGHPYDVALSTDGTKMYMQGRSNDRLFQYTLSTAFDLSTASYDSVSFLLSSQDSGHKSTTFKPDGTKMYMTGSTNDSIYQYTLSTAWDLSTASYDSVSFSVSSQETNPADSVFNTDGTKMYMVGLTNKSVYQYTLSTGFDLSTASYDSVSFSITSQAVLPFSINFNSDGTKMYAMDNLGDTVYQYTLSTGFDLSTASYDSVSFSVSSQDTNPTGFIFSTDSTKMYLSGNNGNAIYQYSTGL